MPRILKVFADADEVPAVLKSAELIQKYDAFVLVEASEDAARKLAQKYPIEDITDQYDLQFGDRTITTSSPRITAEGTVRAHPAYKGARKLGPGPHHYVVQFIGPIKQNWLAQVRKAGATLREPTGNFAYIIRATDAMLAKIAGLKVVRWLGHLPHSDRVSVEIAGLETPTLPRRRVRPGVYKVEIFGAEDAGRIAKQARSLGFKVLSQEPKARVLFVETSKGEAATTTQINRLSAVHGVRFIRERALPRLANNVATTVMGNTYAANASNGLKLSGDGEIVAVCDTGLDSGDETAIHEDFAGRIVAIKSYPIAPEWSSDVTNPGGDDGAADLDSGHGTHVAGSVLGNGAASANGPEIIRGHAHKAKLVFQAIEQEVKWKPNVPEEWKKHRYLLAGIPADMGRLFDFAYKQGARIHSNSWGGGDPGAYDNQSRQFDQFVWDHKDFCFIIAAGNDGSDRDGDGSINLGSVTSPGTAKNVITVGACENVRPQFNTERYGDWWPQDFPVQPVKNDPMANNASQVVAFSSRGPTTDSRVKPELVAPGTFILSARSTRIAPNNFAWGAYPQNKKYFFMGGTSMATPLVAGAAALVREFLRRKRKIAKPSAALVKAVLIAGAERLPKTAPAGTVLDNHQGFGRVNLDRSLKKPLCTIEGDGLHTGEKFTTTVKVPAGGKRGLRIAMCYTDFPGDSLINNLNLVVTAPSGTRYTGNQKSSASGSLALDTNNNAEVVDIAKAAAGKWRIDVLAANVSPGPQDFALAAVLV